MSSEHINDGLLQPNATLLGKFLFGSFCPLTICFLLFFLNLIPWDYFYSDKLIDLFSSCFSVLDKVDSSKTEFPEYTKSVLLFFHIFSPFLMILFFFFCSHHAKNIDVSILYSVSFYKILFVLVGAFLSFSLFVSFAYLKLGGPYHYTPEVVYKEKWAFLLSVLLNLWAVFFSAFMLFVTFLSLLRLSNSK